VASAYGGRFPLFRHAPVLWSLLAALIVWPFLGLASSWFTTAERANAGSYLTLRHEMRALCHRASAVRSVPLEDGRGSTVLRKLAARLQAQALLDGTRQILARAGILWITGRGYIAAWESFHRAEEALNVALDSGYRGLVQLRNQTQVALILAELAAFTLLAIPQIQHADPAAIFAGVVYLLVGAAVGMFGHVYHLSRAQAAVSDYGLAVARILTLPIFSGLAAVTGVVMQTLAGPGSAQTHLATTFSPSNNPAGLVVAAAFGFAPTLLVRALGDRAEEYRDTISSTQASSPGSPRGISTEKTVEALSAPLLHSPPHPHPHNDGQGTRATNLDSK
jgi:hypothetical protein